MYCHPIICTQAAKLSHIKNSYHSQNTILDIYYTNIKISTDLCIDNSYLSITTILQTTMHLGCQIKTLHIGYNHDKHHLLHSYPIVNDYKTPHLSNVSAFTIIKATVA